MKLYADSPGRRGRQLLTDALVLAWIAGWIKLGSVVHELVSQLGRPGEAVASAGRSLERSLQDAADRAGDVPLIGDRLRDPLEAAGGAGQRLQDAGLAGQAAVSRLALILALVVALIPILIVLSRWLPYRLAWIRSASAARRLTVSGDDLDLFALRALTHQPLWRLARLGPDPAGAYLRREPGARDALAALELDELGLALPAGRRPQPAAGVGTDEAGGDDGQPRDPAPFGRSGHGESAGRRLS